MGGPVAGSPIAMVNRHYLPPAKGNKRMMLRWKLSLACLLWLYGIPLTALAAGTLTGRIIDAQTGTGVRCQAWFYSGTCGENYQGQAWSDADGTYTMPDLPAGNVYIRLMPGNAGHTEYVNEYYDGAETCSQADAVMVADGETVSLDLPLHPPSGGGDISGRVTDGSGQPLSGLRVYAYTGKCGSGYLSHGVTSTAADGSFLLAQMPVGDIYVKACPSCTTGFTQVNQWWTSQAANTEDCDLAEPIAVSEGSSHPDIDFVLTSGATIRGTLTRPDGSPVSDSIVVHAYLDNACDGEYISGAVAGFSGAPGVYVLDQLPAGSIYIRTDSFTRPADSNVQKYYDGNGGSLNCNDAVPLELAPGQTVSQIDMTIPVGGDISGAVMYDGLPAGPAWLYVYLGTYPNGFWLTTDHPGHTDDDGSFLLRHIPEGDVSVYVYPRFGFEPVWWTGENQPGTPYIDLATPVQVDSGQETPGVLFGLTDFNGDGDGDRDVDGDDLAAYIDTDAAAGVLRDFAAQFGQQ